MVEIVLAHATSSSDAGKVPAGIEGKDIATPVGNGSRTASWADPLLNFLIPQHIRKRTAAYHWPTARETLCKAAGLVEWPYFPWAFMDWRQYPKIAFDDFLAGVVVGVILIPQGMSYALLGNLPPIMGLYAATIAGYVYTLLGSSGQLTIGPVALVSTFMTETFASLGVSLDKKDPYAAFVRQHVCAVLSLAVGIMLIAMGAFRLGRLMKFISPSVMTGFTTGCGVYIGLSQVKYLFGVKVVEQKYYYQTYRVLVRQIRDHADPETMKVGWGAWAVLFFFWVLKKAVKGTPERRKKLWYKLFLAGSSGMTLVMLIVVTLVTQRLHEQGKPIPIIGHIPAGFNPFVAPKINHFGLPFGTVMVKAIPLMLLCYMESMAVARKYAVANRYQVDNNQEMWAIGMGCIVASFFTAYPPGGSFSRTALKAELGVKTPFANVYASLLVTIVLVRLTGLLKYVPMAFLGAVIDVAVLSLLDFAEIYKALWVAPVDFLVMVFTFVLTAFFNTEMGLEFGILASIVVLVWQISSLDVYAIGQLRHSADGTLVFADVSKYPDAQLSSRIRVLRLTASLFFGNVGAFRDEFIDSLNTGANIETVIVDAQGVSNLDLTTLSVFHELYEHCHKNDIKLRFANVSSKLVFYLEGYELLDHLGGEARVTRSLEDVYAEVLGDIGEQTPAI